MKAHLIRIGNSRGIRLPKVIIEQAQLTDDVLLEVRGSSVVITATKKPRHGWADAAKLLHSNGGDSLLDPDLPNDFDHEQWQW